MVGQTIDLRKTSRAQHWPDPTRGLSAFFQGKVLIASCRGSEILQTGLEGKYARNPIVGSAGDIVVAFSGGAGTLVELAYAALKKRPIIFHSSIDYLRVKCSLEAKDLKEGLEEARSAYSLIPAKNGDLEDELVACLANPKAVCVDTPEAVVRRIFGFPKEAISVQQETNFLGLPSGKRWREEFNKCVAKLSKLE